MQRAEEFELGPMKVKHEELARRISDAAIKYEDPNAYMERYFSDVQA